MLWLVPRAVCRARCECSEVVVVVVIGVARYNYKRIKLFRVRTVAYTCFCFEPCPASLQLAARIHAQTTAWQTFTFQRRQDMWHFYFVSRKLIYHCFLLLFFSFAIYWTATCDAAADID